MYLTNEKEVQFEELDHKYFRHGLEYTPVSTVLHTFEPSFDRAVISRGVAKSEGRHYSEVQKEWDDKRDEAANYGTYIHDQLEQAWNIGYTPDPSWQLTFEQVQLLVRPYKKVFPEKTVYHDATRIAGTVDLPTMRALVKKRQFVDVFDYKTNISKGITLYKSYINKHGKWVHSDEKFFLEPISHLEASLYNKYALQMSLYGAMIETNYQAFIGRMGILYIDLNRNVHVMPVPYLRNEAFALLEAFSKLRPVA